MILARRANAKESRPFVIYGRIVEERPFFLVEKIGSRLTMKRRHYWGRKGIINKIKYKGAKTTPGVAYGKRSWSAYPSWLC